MVRYQASVKSSAIKVFGGRENMLHAGGTPDAVCWCLHAIGTQQRPGDAFCFWRLIGEQHINIPLGFTERYFLG